MNKALLVGINKYVSMPNNCLQGCVNDVTNMCDILTKFFNFSSANIRIITDEKADKNGIYSGLDWLIKDAKKGDKLVFHYSGHGSQVPDTNKDESDGLDEIICPTNINWDKCTYITDDDLYNLITIPIGIGAKVEVVLDSCHSGTGTRQLAAMEFLPESLKMKLRYLPPPVDLHHRYNYDAKKTKILRSTNSKVMNHVLYAGCMENQTCADANIKGKYNGAFTYYLCKTIRDCQGNIVRDELIRRVRASLSHDGFDQIPQLECPTVDITKKVFTF